MSTKRINQTYEARDGDAAHQQSNQQILAHRRANPGHDSKKQTAKQAGDFNFSPCFDTLMRIVSANRAAPTPPKT